MKNALIKLWKFHGFIGKILTIVCLALVLGGLLGLITGVSKCSSTNEVVATNYFLNEEVPLHDGNYAVIVVGCWTGETIETIGKDLTANNMVGNFINVELSINQSENSSLKTHVLDSDDFKLKDHTGVYIPLNDLLGAVGWDGIDVHVDTADGGHVMSSASFSTRDSVMDYDCVGKGISTSSPINTTLHFEMNELFKA